MKPVIYTKTILVVTALLLSIVTCYGKDDPSDLLVGKWTKLFNERTVTFTITSDFKFQVEFVGDAEIDVWGSYVISGAQITFNDEGGQYGSNDPGVYEFKVSDKSLTYTEVNDPVYGRKLMVEGNWLKASKVE